MEEFNLSKVVCEYVAARDAHELATRPLNSHAPVRRLPHGSPITRRWCDARESLRLALENREAIPTYQSKVAHWMGLCFDTPHSRDITERGDRFLEEVLELLQSNGYDQTRVSTLVNYVYGRPVGEPAQEVGGVMVTLAAYCDVVGLDMHHAGDTELARVMQPSVMDKIRAKQAAKNSLHFDTPLPGNAGVAQAAEAPGIVHVEMVKSNLLSIKSLARVHPIGRVSAANILCEVDHALDLLDANFKRVCPCGSGDVEKCPGGCTALQDNSKVGKCTACNGHGMIGGLLPASGGYDSQPCPDCSTKGSDERARFESWASKYWSVEKGVWAGELRYHSDYAQRTWDAWRAALQATSANGCRDEVLEALRKRAEFPDYVTLDYAKDGDGTGPAWWKRRRFELENSGYTLWYEADNGTETYVLVGLGDELRNAIASAEVKS